MQHIKRIINTVIQGYREHILLLNAYQMGQCVPHLKELLDQDQDKN